MALSLSLNCNEILNLFGFSIHQQLFCLYSPRKCLLFYCISLGTMPMRPLTTAPLLTFSSTQESSTVNTAKRASGRALLLLQEFRSQNYRREFNVSSPKGVLADRAQSRLSSNYSQPVFLAHSSSDLNHSFALL